MAIDLDLIQAKQQNYDTMSTASLLAQSQDKDRNALDKAKDLISKFKKAVHHVRIDRRTVICVPADHIARADEYRAKLKQNLDKPINKTC